MDAFSRLAHALNEAGVRYVVIGVWGANYYASSAHTVFTTQDRDLFLPPDPKNLVACWKTCDAVGLDLTVGTEPLDSPRDVWLAERLIERRSLVRATDRRGLDVDLTLVMTGFDFETVRASQRRFTVYGVEIPVARLLHIVTSKHAAGREKDLLFLATHRDALAQMLSRNDSSDD